MEQVQERWLILIRGVQGSGKTTLAKIFEGFGAKIFAADDWFTDPDGTYTFDGAQLGRAHNHCRDRAKLAMMNKTPFVVIHNTFAKAAELKPYMSLAEEWGYKVQTIVVENRHGNKDLHSVPDEVRQRIAETLKSSIQLV